MKFDRRLSPVTVGVLVAGSVLSFVAAAFIFLTLPDVPLAANALMMVSSAVVITGFVLSTRDRLR
ncbi:hypothetical protein HTZ77_04430 [Nonomuraea sp. SMC257]|uniref:Uncharacterized protein n=1 Tax=Nonomuraea montanisoli TaxID=2741721 RepID=A0A7Y6I362_9ACTN|nr:hypothetical protein [Nonomuraea montanisoli]NUW30671.1 hypothetical protein [Nonomuraea montanisoli]